MATNVHRSALDDLVHIQLVDGITHGARIASLVDNNALRQWREDPSTILHECRYGSACRQPAQCRYAHFVEPVLEAGPAPPPQVALGSLPVPPSTQAQTVPIPSASVAFAMPNPIRSPMPTFLDMPPLGPHETWTWMPPDHGAIRQAHIPQRSARWQRTVDELIGCRICCDVVPPQHVYVCDAQHQTCSLCLTAYILENWRDNRIVSGGGLRCCQPGCTSRPLTVQDVLRLVTSTAALEVYISHTMRQTAAQCFAEAHAIVLQEAPQATSAADALLHKQLQKSMHAARMCPNCQFGPIDFFGCDNLAQHHGEERNGVRTNNSCQRCGYFTPRIDGWERWDGVARNLAEPVERWSGTASYLYMPPTDVVLDDGILASVLAAPAHEAMLRQQLMEDLGRMDGMFGPPRETLLD
ncbi:Hypothetical protein, putative [Bodo saltans]|uniref:C3H1-type domain-containing protein n=1 Tax=Bodo saltans TaxID=75058 RepID=A0A0S4JG15_BODSA|nr:Hypothetical protein, putative [Bodo saltans]|eukprot:CUG90484.1 Hypothetical protein, putative [Bodo saltans]